MVAHITRITDFFGAPQALVRQPRREWMVEKQRLILEEDPTINQTQQFIPKGVKVDQGQQGEHRRVKQQIHREIEAPRVMMVNRNQNVDGIIHRVR